jgi:sugar phosphate isomerase/epimerase
MRELLQRGNEQGVGVALEPEPGMFIERPFGYSDLVERLGADGDELGLCLDVGHLLCSDDPSTRDVPSMIRCYANRLFMVHLDDIAGGIHEHRMLGEGELDLRATLQALIEVGYDGMAAVELSRDGHRAPQAAREAMQRLKAALATR